MFHQAWCTLTHVSSSLIATCFIKLDTCLSVHYHSFVVSFRMGHFGLLPIAWITWPGGLLCAEWAHVVALRVTFRFLSWVILSFRTVYLRCHRVCQPRLHVAASICKGTTKHQQMTLCNSFWFVCFMLCWNDTLPQPFLGFLHRLPVFQSVHYGLVSAPDSALHTPRTLPVRISATQRCLLSLAVLYSQLFLFIFFCGSKQLPY